MTMIPPLVPRRSLVRALLKGIVYPLRCGCSWRILPMMCGRSPLCIMTFGTGARTALGSTSMACAEQTRDFLTHELADTLWPRLVRMSGMR